MIRRGSGNEAARGQQTGNNATLVRLVPERTLLCDEGQIKKPGETGVELGNNLKE